MTNPSSPNSWIDILFGALAKEEGAYTPGTKPNRLNNPLDLRFAGQPGATRPTPPARGLEPIAQFDTLTHGIAAGYRQLWADIARGMSLRELIHSWAPPSENNTDSYLKNVATWIGCTNPDTPLLSSLTLPTPPSAPKGPATGN